MTNKIVVGLLLMIVTVMLGTSIAGVYASIEAGVRQGTFLAIIPFAFFACLTHGYLKVFEIVEKEFEKVGV